MQEKNWIQECGNAKANLRNAGMQRQTQGTQACKAFQERVPISWTRKKRFNFFAFRNCFNIGADPTPNLFESESPENSNDAMTQEIWLVFCTCFSTFSGEKYQGLHAKIKQIFHENGKSSQKTLMLICWLLKMVNSILRKNIISLSQLSPSGNPVGSLLPPFPPPPHQTGK